MKVVIIIFMIVVLVIGVLSVGLVLYDLITNIKNRKKKEQTAEDELENSEPNLPSQPIASQPTALQQPILLLQPENRISNQTEVVATVGETENGVSFAIGKPLSLHEKYLALAPIARGYFDDITQYAAAKEKSVLSKTEPYYEYKQGNTKLVRLHIKRETVTCEFIITNSDFRNYLAENKIKVKQRPTILRVVDERTKKTAQDSIDLIERLAKEESEYKKQLSKAKRKASIAKT